MPGKHAPWYCSPEPIYGPDELGDYQNAVEQMIQNVNRCDAAARIWEVLQAWEMRLFNRNYHFLSANQKGWGLFGQSGGMANVGASIMATQNGMKLFACNVFGARHDKIVAALSREVPATAVVPKDENDSIDQAAQEEAEKYLKVYANDASLKKAVVQTSSYAYTDDRAVWLTYTVADANRWGTETPDRPQAVYGAPEPDGLTPETSQMPVNQDGEVPARREVTQVLGKLESKVPLMSDEFHEMPWVRGQWETGVNILKAKYPWIKQKIATQGNVGGMDQIDRMARINCRLAVQASSSSGEAYKNDATETVTFFRPSEYEGIEDEGMRQVFYDEFPDGLEVWHAGGQLAFIRNCRMSKHVHVFHPFPGSGQNRRAIGTNYLPLQKVLNANISLIDRYFRSAVPRRFALEPYIDTQAINSQANDPAKITPVTGLENKQLRIADITGVEQVPSPNDSIMQFVQWLIQGAPEIMDNAVPAMFGMDAAEQQTAQEAKLKRDQALQVYSMPWGALCEAVSCASLQAIESAAENRVANISASLPGQQRLEIEIEKLRGSVLVYPESLEIPRTLAEQEEQMAALLADAPNVALYQAIMNDPRNLAVFAKFPSMADLEVPGADQVEEQQGEFEILMRSGPQPNPQIALIQQQIEQGQMEMAQLEQQALLDPNAAAQLQQMQQMMAQLQQALQTLPPEVSTVPVAQDTSENHAIHAAITLGMLTGATGRKLKYGSDEQKAVYQNLKLHWQEHMEMSAKLTPPQPVPAKASVTVDPSKLPPEAQAKVFQALGLMVSPAELEPDPMTHEVTEEKEGIDENGVPVKQKVSVVGKPLN